MAEAILPQERLLYATYFPPHVYQDGNEGGQPIVTTLFQESTKDGGAGYAIREYSLAKGEMFYRFPKSGSHWSRAVIKQEWYRETETRLPDWVFEVTGGAP
jgi:hypothetical protein